MKFVVLVVLLCSVIQAQQPPEDPLRGALFPPEAIMQNQQALGLSDDQKNALKNDLRQAQTRFSELQWALEDAVERLATLLKAPKVDEKTAAEQLDKVLNAEREVKRAQLLLLVRLKNSLTAAQQTQLRELLQKSKSPR
jgi:Spy/CpxP family protein refolding chaperone